MTDPSQTTVPTTPFSGFVCNTCGAEIAVLPCVACGSTEARAVVVQRGLACNPFERAEVISNER